MSGQQYQSSLLGENSDCAGGDRALARIAQETRQNKGLWKCAPGV